MKVLLDECVTRKLKRDFQGHEIYTVEEAGLKGLKNEALYPIMNQALDALKQIKSGEVIIIKGE